MAIKRVVDTSFWTDDKVVELFSPEDKLFMLYLLTNPHTKQLGIYSINTKIIAFELGYSVDTINILLERFENKYGMIKYSHETREIAIKNYLKYSIIKGGKPVEDCLIADIKNVKNKSLLKFIFENLKDCESLNITVNKILDELNINDNDNDNDNDNEVSYHDTYNDTLNSNNELEKEFATLWLRYPKKVGKKEALKEYIKARAKEKTTFEVIAEGIEKYLRYCEQNKWYSPKDGCRWFKKRSWEDELNTEETFDEKLDRIAKEVEMEESL